MNKLKEALAGLKAHWKTPPPGYQVSYKEFANFTLGCGGQSFVSILVTWTGIAMNIPMMITYFKVSTGMIFVFTIVSSLIGLLRAPILSLIIDNFNSPKGKFKPFLIWSMALTALCFGIVPFIPQNWVDNILWRFTIPELPIFGVAASSVELSLGVLVMFLLIQIGTVFNTLLNQCLAGIEQTISTVAQERANIGSLKGLIAYIPGSVINIVMPLVAGIFFSVGDTTGMNNITLYRIFFPICGVGGLILILFTVYGTKERAVVHREYVQKVKMSEGLRSLSKNKYFWIITIFGVALGVRAYSNIYFWTCTYAIGGKAGDTAIAVCNMVLNNAMIPGMLFGPLLIKKFGKRTVMITSNIGFTVMAALQLLFLKNPYLILVGIFFQNLFTGFSYISAIMTSDVLDYQQWKSGKRLEGFWQNYNNFIVTFIGIFTGILSPLFLSFGGIGFGDNIDVALQNPTIMESAFRNITYLGIIGAMLTMVPMFFYDLTEAKHANYIRALKVRAAVENYRTNVLSDEDVVNVKEIISYTEEKKDTFLQSELAQYDCLPVITEDYEKAVARLEASKKQAESIKQS